jgi:protein TonB
LKRLLYAAIAAIGLHALLLTVKIQWEKDNLSLPPSPICLSLTYETPEARQLPSPGPTAEPLRRPDPPEKIPEEPKQNPVSERKPSPPKKRVPRKVPREKPAPETPAPQQTKESQTVRDKVSTDEREAGVSSPLTSERSPSSTPNGAHSLALKSDSGEKKAYLRQAVPLYLKNPPPEYPSIARRRGYEGTVVMEVFVDREGGVREIKLFQSSGHNVLDRAAMQAVRGWLFEPAKRGEEKVDMWVKVPLTFHWR